MLARVRTNIAYRLRNHNLWAGAVVLLTVAGAILRFFHLGRQSLWYDETYSVHLASMTLGDAMLWTARDVVPPLYYHLLHFWQGTFGTSEAAVRSLSALAGTLTIPLFYATSRLLFGHLHGLLAAMLVTLSPLHIWYSQEARMYALLTFFGLLAGWFLLKVLAAQDTRRRRTMWLGFLLAATATSYSHTAGLLLLAFFGFAFVMAWTAWIRQRVIFAEAAGVGLAFGAIHLPWIPLALRNLGANRGFWEGVLGIEGVVRRVFLSYWTGKTIFSDAAESLLPALVAVVALTVAALAVESVRAGRAPCGGSLPRWFTVLFAALYSVFPVALFIILFHRTPKFDPRYLYLTSPGFLILAGAGIASLLRGTRRRFRRGARFLGTAALLFLLGVFAWGDYNNFYDPRFQRDDFRSVAEYIKERIGPNETVILCSGHFFPAFQYYFGPDNWHPLPNEPILNTERVLSYQVADDLNRILRGKDGVWVVFWQDRVADPNGFLTMMLNEQGSRLPSGPQFWGVRYVHWTLNEDAHFSAVPRVQQPQQANFGNRLKLLGFSIGTAEHLLLYWQALQPMTKDYSVSLRLVDDRGVMWGSLDRRPAGYYFPTSRWLAGEPLFGSNPIPSFSGTPPGEYWLDVVVYDERSGARLNVLDEAGAPQGQSARIGPLRLTELQPMTSADPLPPAAPVLFGDSMEVLFLEVDRAEAGPGESVSVVAYWQALRALGADCEAELALAAQDGTVIAARRVLLGTPEYPTSLWASGAPVRWVARLAVPATAMPGDYALRLSVWSQESDEAIGQHAQIAALRVKEFGRIFTPPAAGLPIGANLGSYAELYGADVEPRTLQPGEELRVSLHWLAKAQFPKSYTVFVHLLGQDNRVRAQQDLLPQNGARPTMGWLPGEYITDEYVLRVKPDTPAGRYWVEVGMYDAADPAFPRMPILDADGQPIADRVLLATIEVK